MSRQTGGSSRLVMRNAEGTATELLALATNNGGNHSASTASLHATNNNGNNGNGVPTKRLVSSIRFGGGPSNGNNDHDTSPLSLASVTPPAGSHATSSRSIKGSVNGVPVMFGQSVTPSSSSSSRTSTAGGGIADNIHAHPFALRSSLTRSASFNPTATRDTRFFPSSSPNHAGSLSGASATPTSAALNPPHHHSSSSMPSHAAPSSSSSSNGSFTNGAAFSVSVTPPQPLSTLSSVTAPSLTASTSSSLSTSSTSTLNGGSSTGNGAGGTSSPPSDGLVTDFQRTRMYKPIQLNGRYSGVAQRTGRVQRTEFPQNGDAAERGKAYFESRYKPRQVGGPPPFAAASLTTARASSAASAATSSSITSSPSTSSSSSSNDEKDHKGMTSMSAFTARFGLIGGRRSTKSDEKRSGDDIDSSPSRDAPSSTAPATNNNGNSNGTLKKAPAAAESGKSNTPPPSISSVTSPVSSSGGSQGGGLQRSLSSDAVNFSELDKMPPPSMSPPFQRNRPDQVRFEGDDNTDWRTVKEEVLETMEEKLEQLRAVLVPKAKEMESQHAALADLAAKFDAHQLASTKKIQALEAEVEALRKRCRDMNTQYKEQRRNVLDRLQEIKSEAKAGQGAHDKKFAEWRDYIVVCFTYGALRLWHPIGWLLELLITWCKGTKKNNNKQQHNHHSPAGRRSPSMVHNGGNNGSASSAATSSAIAGAPNNGIMNGMDKRSIRNLNTISSTSHHSIINGDSQSSSSSHSLARSRSRLNDR